jgi:predicted dehydrogenase
MDLMRLLAGDARWCHARVVYAGDDVTPATVREAGSGIGLVAGDDVVAQFGFDHGITGSFESTVSGDEGGNEYLRTEVSGTGGTLVFWNDSDQPACFIRRPFPLPPNAASSGAEGAAEDEWQLVRLEPLALPEGVTPAAPRQAANQVLMCDLLAAIEQDRPPRSSGHDGRAALEMILAVYESHIRGQRVALPLEGREHPLARWTH